MEHYEGCMKAQGSVRDKGQRCQRKRSLGTGGGGAPPCWGLSSVPVLLAGALFVLLFSSDIVCVFRTSQVAARGVLVTVALNMHGTRAVQKLVETLSNREQKTMLVGLGAQGWEIGKRACTAGGPLQQVETLSRRKQKAVLVGGCREVGGRGLRETGRSTVTLMSA